MRSRNSSLWGMLCLLLICGATETGYAKSVFAVTSHGSSIIKAYNINGDKIDYQAEVESGTFGIGAVGLCVWPDKELMFVTYENEGVISWASTKTLDRDEGEDEISTGTDNLAGIAADDGKDKIYIIERETDSLFVYTWNETNKTLVLDAQHDLPDLYSGIGIQLNQR